MKRMNIKTLDIMSNRTTNSNNVRHQPVRLAHVVSYMIGQRPIQNSIRSQQIAKLKLTMKGWSPSLLHGRLHMCWNSTRVMYYKSSIVRYKTHHGCWPRIDQASVHKINTCVPPPICLSTVIAGIDGCTQMIDFAHTFRTHTMTVVVYHKFWA